MSRYEYKVVTVGKTFFLAQRSSPHENPTVIWDASFNTEEEYVTLGEMWDAAREDDKPWKTLKLAAADFFAAVSLEVSKVWI